MHDIVYYGAMIWMTGLLCMCLWMVVKAKASIVRILSLDALTLVLVSHLILYSTTTGTSFYLDAALMLAMISFISSLVAARYWGERKVF